MKTKTLKPILIVLSLTVLSLICFSNLSALTEEKLKLNSKPELNVEVDNSEAQALFHKGKYKKDLAKKRAFVEKQQKLIEKVNVKSS